MSQEFIAQRVAAARPLIQRRGFGGLGQVCAVATPFFLMGALTGRQPGSLLSPVLRESSGRYFDLR